MFVFDGFDLDQLIDVVNDGGDDDDERIGHVCIRYQKDKIF